MANDDPYELSDNLVAARGETKSLSPAEMANLPIDTVRFIGDSHIYIDILDYDFLPQTSATTQIQSGHVIRSFYTNTTPTYVVHTIDPQLIAESHPAIQAAVDAGAAAPSYSRSSIRMYDRGECSASLSWRSFGERLAAEFDAEIDDKIKEFDVPIAGTPCFHPVGNWSIEPLLRNDGDADTFQFARGYELYDCSVGIPINLPFVLVRVEISMEGVGGVLVANMMTSDVIVRQSAVVNWFGGDLVFNAFNNALQDSLTPKIEAAVRGELSQMTPFPRVCEPGAAGNTFCDTAQRGLVALDAGVPASRYGSHNFLCERDPSSSLGGSCVVVPNIHKVNFRPDGFEIVLADEALSADGLSGDPFYERLAAETYNGAPLCDRSVPAVLETACYQNAVFEILPNNFPEVCGDNLLTP